MKKFVSRNYQFIEELNFSFVSSSAKQNLVRDPRWNQVLVEYLICVSNLFVNRLEFDSFPSPAIEFVTLRVVRADWTLLATASTLADIRK